MMPQVFPTFLENKIRLAELAQNAGPLIRIRAEEYILLLRLAKCATLCDTSALPLFWRVDALREFYAASIPVPEGKEL